MWMVGEFWKEKERYRRRVFDLTNGEWGNNLAKVVSKMPPPVRCYHFDKEANACASPSQTKKHSAWSKKDVKALNRISEILVDASEVKNWWEESRLIERDEMIKLTNFLKSIKDRVQPKCVWSEEDEENLNQLHKLIVEKAYRDYEIDTDGETLYGKWLKLDNWLKFLKDRVQPQPKQEWSEEDEIDNCQKVK